MPEQYFSLIAFLFGATFGSFLNVVIYRLPLGISIVTPKSRCPKCETPISPLHNIPILSYLALRGKCASCGVKIPLRYPTVEALTGVAWLGLWLRFGNAPEFWAFLVLVTGLIVITFIDIDHKIIPDSLSITGIPLGLASSFFTGVGPLDSLLGILLGGGTLWAVASGYELLTKREGMGFGDVKLLGAIGAFLGWQAVLFTIVMSSVVGAVIGVLLIKLSSADRHLEIPFGPFLSLGAALYVYRGPELIAWYLGAAL